MAAFLLHSVNTKQAKRPVQDRLAMLYERRKLPGGQAHLRYWSERENIPQNCP
jgi:hypothetical protein